MGKAPQSLSNTKDHVELQPSVNHQAKVPRPNTAKTGAPKAGAPIDYETISARAAKPAPTKCRISAPRWPACWPSVRDPPNLKFGSPPRCVDAQSPHGSAQAADRPAG